MLRVFITEKRDNYTVRKRQRSWCVSSWSAGRRRSSRSAGCDWSPIRPSTRRAATSGRRADPGQGRGAGGLGRRGWPRRRGAALARPARRQPGHGGPGVPGNGPADAHHASERGPAGGRRHRRARPGTVGACRPAQARRRACTRHRGPCSSRARRVRAVQRRRHRVRADRARHPDDLPQRRQRLARGGRAGRGPVRPGRHRRAVRGSGPAARRLRRRPAHPGQRPRRHGHPRSSAPVTRFPSTTPAGSTSPRAAPTCGPPSTGQASPTASSSSRPAKKRRTRRLRLAFRSMACGVRWAPTSPAALV